MRLYDQHFPSFHQRIISAVMLMPHSLPTHRRVIQYEPKFLLEKNEAYLRSVEAEAMYMAILAIS